MRNAAQVLVSMLWSAVAVAAGVGLAKCTIHVTPPVVHVFECAPTLSQSKAPGETTYRNILKCEEVQK